ncbi:hypothetical protein GCM10010112_67860 [Actinoplanes lobatus]|uniref:Uncharacterized protein n=1 Tax=Actinoplanes lobatus TaxID=113568 RepID=A0A7W7MG86_9ACTN|nr:hypothetical protein [Actinoplanes lobatus]MBB4749134.1 hypothetical protein [Actinoplanes lobatus]GGN86369.1 hypothetical protein GCM10010112_67860 [Actinoplanes lobatus]GIE42768.1 hypothetical protein Alo02nite_56660 [Actinoplanes lobatus]
MTTGLSTTYADSVLNVRRATNFTAYTAHAKLHTGDPGAAGTSNASAETTRKALTFAAPSTVSTNRSSTATAVSWTSWSAGSETISHISEWDASSSGNFMSSGALASSKAVANGDTLTVTVTATQGGLAA